MLRPRTRAAIAVARAAGIRVLVATGRMFQSVRPYLAAAGISDPVVCYQGAVVADPASGRFLRHEPIPLELARETIAAVERQGFPVNCYVDDELYVASETREAREYAGRLERLVDVHVELHDERFTTKLARRSGGRAAEDSRAAAVLLESWLAGG